MKPKNKTANVYCTRKLFKHRESRSCIPDIRRGIQEKKGLNMSNKTI